MLTNTRRAAFAVCGSFCTLETALAAAARLQAGGWELLPILSNTVSALDTRFGRAADWRARLEALTGSPVRAARWQGWRRAFPIPPSRWRPRACCGWGGLCCWPFPPTMAWALPGRT